MEEIKMKENVEKTLRMMVNEKASGKNSVWDAKGNRRQETVWKHCLHTYRSKNGKYLVHELRSSEALDEVADYLKAFGHEVFIDRYQHTVYADDQKVVVGYGKHNSLAWEGESLVITLHSTLPVKMREVKA